VPLVAGGDREEVIAYKVKIMLRRTIFKNFMSIATETRPLLSKARAERHARPIDSSVPVCLISPWRAPWSTIGTVSAHAEFS
jgi:hypothetical protein